jgi:hypothetical protein
MSGNKSGEAKKHSRASEAAMKDADRHAAGTNDAVPAAESGTRAHSEAAHLEARGNVHAHTKPEGDIRQVEVKEESNRVVGRAGEVHRGE